MVKPDGFRRGLTGEIIGRMERKGWRLVGMKLMQVSEDLARAHYAEHVNKPFFGELVRFITSAPVVAMVWEGRKVIAGARALMGATDPAAAAPGTIRGDLATEITENVIHGSASPADAEREIALWFNGGELVD